MSAALFGEFEAHVEGLQSARARRQEILAFRSALEDEGGDKNDSADASLDERDCLGVWLPTDQLQGDVNMRTLEKLLVRVDQRGFERYAHANPLRFSHPPPCARHRCVCPLSRSAQQLEFHVAFMKAAARVIYRGSWETERPSIMRKYGWEVSNSEVLISTPRRFGKTFSIAIFCACLALSFGLIAILTLLH
tara:strand:+ start:231 stop:806 length:576 start_codon:yes stop_codon:yes gene_type:complete